MLDTWDNVYYPLPFVIALLVWETCSLRRAPLLALSSTVIVWINGSLVATRLHPGRRRAVPRVVGAAVDLARGEPVRAPTAAARTLRKRPSAPWRAA